MLRYREISLWTDLAWHSPKNGDRSPLAPRAHLQFAAGRYRGRVCRFEAAMRIMETDCEMSIPSARNPSGIQPKRARSTTAAVSLAEERTTVSGRTRRFDRR